MQRYFLEESYQENESDVFYLEGEDFHHAIHVMRMQEKDTCYLAFSDNIVIVAEIMMIEAERVCLKEIAKEQQEKELPVKVTIACGYPKGDKLDLVIQKGTELGAHHFVGFPADTSVVKWDTKKLEKKGTRLTKIAKEAAEQSHRQVQPTVELYEKASDFYQSLSSYDAVLIAYEEAAKQGEKSQLVQTLQTIKRGENLLVIIGPEGGLSSKEIELFQQFQGKLCGLGPRILRAETAPFYILSVISYQLEMLRDN